MAAGSRTWRQGSGFRPPNWHWPTPPPEALNLAAQILPAGTKTFQVDLLDLPWTDRWDVAFLLDVLEHIPADEDALRQVYRALAPGGLLFITAPALQVFWSWNDEAVHHVRRYSKANFRQLGAACGYRVLDAPTSCFSSAPFCWRHGSLFARTSSSCRRNRCGHCLARMHRVPGPVVNGTLGLVFCCETPLGHYLPFPWGSSVLAVLQKPRNS